MRGRGHPWRLVAFAACAALAQGQEAAAPAPSAKMPRNLLLITLDTTRRDYVGFMGRSPSPTPSLDQLAKEAIVFDDALTTIPVTLPAHASLLTGLYPTNHGVRYNAVYRLPAEAHTLAEILVEHGYAARAAVASFVLDAIFGLDQGFELYRTPPRLVTHADAPTQVRELPAKEMVDRALMDLHELTTPKDPANGATSKPFFYWLHLYDAHAPYQPPDPPKLTPAQQADSTQFNKLMYEAEIRCMDRELGRLFAALREMKLLERTLVVVTADHGEGLRDSPEANHGFFLLDPTVRVPLFLRDPDRAATTIHVQASLIDLAPTLLSLLGIGASGERFDGVDLTPWIDDPSRPPPDRSLMLESLFAWVNFGWAPQFGCAHGPIKYLRSVREELFDRASDPTESHNLFRPDDPRAAGLKRQLEAHLSGAHPLLHASMELSETDRARLQALGYVVNAGALEELPADWSALPDTYTKMAVMDRFQEVMMAADQGKMVQAIEMMHALVAAEPKCVTLLEQFALTALAAGDAYADEASAEFEAILKLDPRRPRAWFGRARCAEIAATRERLAAKELRDQNKNKEARPHADAERAAHELAESALKKSLECDPNYPDALSMLAKMQAEQGDRALRRKDKSEAAARYADAEKLFARLLALLPPTTSEWAEAATLRLKIEQQLQQLAGGS